MQGGNLLKMATKYIQEQASHTQISFNLVAKIHGVKSIMGIYAYPYMKKYWTIVVKTDQIDKNV